MVFILAASSLRHAIESLTPDEKALYKDKLSSIPGLILNPNTKNPKKVVLNLLSKISLEKTTLLSGMMS